MLLTPLYIITENYETHTDCCSSVSMICQNGLSFRYRCLQENLYLNGIGHQLQVLHYYPYEFSEELKITQWWNYFPKVMQEVPGRNGNQPLNHRSPCKHKN